MAATASGTRCAAPGGCGAGPARGRAPGWGRRRWAAVALLVGLALSGAAQAEAPLRAPPPVPRGGDAAPAVVPRLAETGREIARRIGLTGHVGWVLADLDTGEVIDAFSPERSFAPASVAKLPTALFALASLGAGHRFETRLVATGPVEGGVLKGDLVLAGGGDPELDSDALAELVEALARAGVAEVAGRLLVDAGTFLSVPEIDPDQPVDVAYNPSVSGLNLNFNRIFLQWQGTEVALFAKGELAAPEVEAVRAEVAADAPGPFAHRIEPGAEIWRLSRRVLGGRGSRWLPVKRPELYAGDVLRALARARGIRLPRPEAAPEAAQGGTRVLGRRLSRPLGEILRDMLRFSTNLTAEVVGAAAATARGEPPKSLAQSAALMSGWAARIAGGAPGDPRLRFVNHSGLTTLSRVSPARMAQFLVASAREAAGPLERVAETGLPGPGPRLLRRFEVAIEDDPLDLAEVEIRAKTGTMDRIRGLAGYIATGAGRAFAFAIFANDLGARGEARRGIDRRWMARARGFERALLRAWIARYGRAEGRAELNR